jgi:alpha-tubulin suppressor-like RCC1 family protein
MATGRVILIACGYFHSLALLDDGTVREWGLNTDGQRTDQNFLGEGRRITQIACGSYYSLALLDNGTVRGWGDNSYGQRTDQNFLLAAPVAAPAVIPAAAPIIASICGICLESKNYNIDFDHPKRIKVLGCGHTFHNDCISNWFQFKGSNE